MLNYSILQAKPTITKKTNGVESEEYKDLLSKVLNTEIDDMRGGTFVEVTPEYVCRPDLVSFAMYGTDTYADILCKLNGISNPFELNAGMILYIPDQSYFSELVLIGKSCKQVKNDNEQLSSPIKTNQKRKKDRRSPAEQIVGENTFIIDKTLRIVYY